MRVKKYKERYGRSKFSQGDIAKVNMGAKKFISGNMPNRQYEAFIWELLKVLDSLGTLKRGIVDNEEI